LYNCNFYRFGAGFGLFRQCFAQKHPHSEFGPFWSKIGTPKLHKTIVLSAYCVFNV
jgi:hypothetical protein